MRIALISDIHGNVAALDAVIAELRNERVDQIICLGDVPVGPFPVETVARLRELACPVIRGNWDALMLNGLPSFDDELGRKIAEQAAWAAAQLSEEDRDYMRTFMRQIELPLNGEGSLLCYHGSPRALDDPIEATTPVEELETMLGGCEATVMAGGHTHFQMLRLHRDSLLVNPGSVGLPFRRARPADPVQVAAKAEYALIEADAGRIGVELYSTSYDVEGFLRGLPSSLPHAEWWVSCWAVG